jgi:hypothetical protein
MVETVMKLLCPNNCDPGRYQNVGFRLVGVPITLKDDLTIDVDNVYSAVINIHKGLIPGAKIVCGGCHQQAIIEE